MEMIRFNLLFFKMLLLIAFSQSCSSDNKGCPPFNYTRWGLDSAKLSKPIILVKGGDSLIFIAEDLDFKYPVRGSYGMSAGSCDNGYSVVYRCPKIWASYEVTFLRQASGYYFQVSFPAHSFPGYNLNDSKYVRDVNQERELSMSVRSPYAYFRGTFNFRAGQLYFFENLMGDRWYAL